MNDFYRIGDTEFDAVNYIKKRYSGKFIFMFKGQICPKHYHRFKKEKFLSLRVRYNLRLETGGLSLNRGIRP